MAGGLDRYKVTPHIHSYLEPSMSQTTGGQRSQERNAKEESQSIDLGVSPREAGTYHPPGEGGTDQSPGGGTSHGASWLAVVLWLGAALLGMNGLTTLVGSVSAMSDPSASAWGSMGVVMGLGMLLVAALLALAANAAGTRRD
jgi:hypothetical protein